MSIKEISQTLSWTLHFDNGFLEANLQRLVFLLPSFPENAIL